MKFSKLLIQWYLENKRDLPWRNTKNPYLIWLSEIILQQTRVAQGLPYFIAFTNAFPTVYDLGNASEQEVLKLWQGLGYYSRARNLHKTAQHVAFDLKGIFPRNYLELIHLKGVGEYTAAAIASFCYDEKVAVVDGNVFRVLSRYFEVETDISLQTARKEFQNLAFELIENESPALFNQAIMEFGALQCVPKSPNCSVCVMNKSCLALQKKKVNLLPVKSKKTKVTQRYFNYLILEDELQNTIINQRTEKGIWHNLYQFPLIETQIDENLEAILSKMEQESPFKNKVVALSELNSSSIIHKLSHQHLHIKFWKVNVSGTLINGISMEKALEFPFPIVIYNFIENHFFEVI